MKIAFFINSLTGGGAERNVVNLANHLVNEHEISIYLMENTIVYTIDKRISVKNLKLSNQSSSFLKFIQIPYVTFRLFTLIKTDHPDYLVSFLNRANYSTALLKLFKIPFKVILSERISPKECYLHGLSGFLNRKLIKYLYPMADLIMPNSIHTKDQLCQYFGIKSKQYVLHNSIDLANINTTSHKDPYSSIDNHLFNLLFIGRLEKQKGLDYLLCAMDKLRKKNIILNIAGVGSMESDLKNKVKNLDLDQNIKFLGFQSNPFDLMCKSDCFVLSSNYEGFPNVLIEALAHGLPVVSTDCNSGPRELLSPGTSFKKRIKNGIEIAEYGILCPIQDSIALAEAINKMASDDNLRKSYMLKGPTRASDFSLQKQSLLFLNALQAV